MSQQVCVGGRKRVDAARNIAQGDHADSRNTGRELYVERITQVLKQRLLDRRSALQPTSDVPHGVGARSGRHLFWIRAGSRRVADGGGPCAPLSTVNICSRYVVR
eukprot:scaffold7504_cov121-Isochrysis_galbana.AAC.9